MSIDIIKKSFFSLTLANILGYFFLSLILYTSTSFIPQITKIAQADCYSIYKYKSCSILGDNYFPLPNQSQCSLNGLPIGYVPINAVCCCTKDSPSQTSPKYILISSVAAFFAIITTLVLFNKKND